MNSLLKQRSLNSYCQHTVDTLYDRRQMNYKRSRLGINRSNPVSLERKKQNMLAIVQKLCSEFTSWNKD